MYGYMKDELTIGEKRRFGVISISDCGRFEDIEQNLIAQYYVRKQLLFIFPTQKNRKTEIEKKRILKLDENKNHLKYFWEKKTRNMQENIRASFFKNVDLIIRNTLKCLILNDL